MLETWLTRTLQLRAPIVGAPMAGVSGGRLAAAISAAGALGMVGVGNATPAEAIAREAELAAAPGAPYGVGLQAWALAQRPEQVSAAIAAGPSLVSVSYGDYARWVEPLHAAGILVATQVGDVAGARAAAQAGVDVIVARGGEGGGHGLDAVATLPLLQAVLDAVDVPVLAAGGIATARGLAAVLAAGAAGAWVGTAFLAATESLSSPAARARVLAATETETFYGRLFDIALQIPWPPVFGGRALRNTFAQRWEGREDELAARPEAADELADARREQDFDIAYLYAGQGVGQLVAERTAAEVVSDMADGAEALLRRW